MLLFRNNHTENKQFYLMMREDKYLSLPKTDRQKIELIKKNGFINEQIEIRDPDNPANLIKARMIKYEI